MARDGGEEVVLDKGEWEDRKLLESGICSKAGTHAEEGKGPLPFVSLWRVTW